MPRGARAQSETGVYHVMVRGINRQDIFLDDEDRRKYLWKLNEAKQRSDCRIYAYCLMDNHLHLLIADGNETIGQAMKRLGSAYVFWYNQKYERVGHLFQDRFLSEPIDNDAYLLTALRYIHQNPLKAGMATACSDYVWSSYRAYIGDNESSSLTDVALGLEMLGGKQRFAQFHQTLGGEELMDVDQADRATDTDVRRMIQPILGDISIANLLAMEIVQRNELLRELKALPGVSHRQLARLIGLSRNVIQRA